MARAAMEMEAETRAVAAADRETGQATVLAEMAWETLAQAEVVATAPGTVAAGLLAHQQLAMVMMEAAH